MKNTKSTDSIITNKDAKKSVSKTQKKVVKFIEPLIQLRKDGVRIVGKVLGLPAELFERIPFPGPALSARVIGEATPERIETARKATVIVERLLNNTGAFQYMGILHEDRV